MKSLKAETTMNVEKFFQVRDMHRAASERAYARRNELARELGIGLGDAQDQPDYKALEAEATRLYWEADALTTHVIRANLERLGITDMVVTGVLHLSDNERIPGGIRFRDGKEAGRSEMLLSDLCGLRYGGLAKKLAIEPRDVSLSVIVEVGGKPIGCVDSDGDFNYEAAPDLLTALGWKIATDGERERLIEFFDLEKATKSILETIRVSGTSKEAFFGPYFEALKRVFVYERTSRFGDGYCGAATVLWHVATRELFNEQHQGYAFGY